MEVCEIARALYSYNNHTGMKFDAGQLLNVFEKGEDGWCWGAVQQSEIEGWFPATYVSTLEQVSNGDEMSSLHLHTIRLRISLLKRIGFAK